VRLERACREVSSPRAKLHEYTTESLERLLRDAIRAIREWEDRPLKENAK
jgi:hypothetical protein